MKKRVLFICTANSCRSQMAEGIINHELGDKEEIMAVFHRVRDEIKDKLLEFFTNELTIGGNHDKLHQ